MAETVFFILSLYLKPSLLATHPSHLPELGEHDHDGGVMLPEHPPEVLHGLGEGALGGDVGVPVAVAVDEAGVDVVRALDPAQRLQAHAAGLEGEDVDKTVLELVDLEVSGDKPGISEC